MSRHEPNSDWPTAVLAQWSLLRSVSNYNCSVYLVVNMIVGRRQDCQSANVWTKLL